MAAVFIVRIEPTAEASLAAIRDRSRLGIAIAAMIRMIATTINNSISEKPFSFFLMISLYYDVLNEVPIGRGTGTPILVDILRTTSKAIDATDRDFCVEIFL